MSLPHPVPKVVYGLRNDVKRNVDFITDTLLVYPCGSAIIFHNLVNNKQKYLLLPGKTIHLYIMAVSPQRNYIACLINEPKKSEIHVFQISSYKRLRTLALPHDSTAERIESMEFSNDERLIVVITGEPEWMMLVYNWERGKVESSTKANYITNPTAPVRRVVCSPTDSSILAIFGQGIFRLMNMQETVWRQYGFQKAENYDIVSCCFLTGDRLLCGTSDGFLLLIDLGELKYIFDAEVVNYINARADKEEEFLGAVTSSMVLERQSSMGEGTNQPERAVRALTALTHGFAYGVGPLVYFFEKSYLHKYNRRNIYRIGDKEFREDIPKSTLTVKHLAANISETKLIAITRRCQFYEVKLWGPEMDIVGEVKFKQLWYPFHTGPIRDLALCPWKPIFLTCGSLDRTVRVWNYETGCLEMMKQYEEDVHSVSLHPTGLYAAIGFPDKLRFVTILIDDFLVYRELPIRECPKSAFNHSGNILAAANKFVIQLFSSITFQNIANLKGHNRTITCLTWTEDDKKLVSCGKDGAVYEWDMKTYKRVGEIVNKTISYLQTTLTSNGRMIYAVATDNCIKEIRSSNILRNIDLKLQGMNQVVLSRSDQIMFAAADRGAIISIKYPIEEPVEYETVLVHCKNITQMKMSFNDNFIITCSEVGTIIVWEIERAEGKKAILDKNFTYFEEILITKTDLEEKLTTINDLTQRTYELEMEHAYQMRHTNTVYQEKIKDLNATYQQAIEELKGTLEVLETNHNKELNNVTSDINAMKERHEVQMLELESKYNAELIEEYNKIKNLENVKTAVTEEYEKKLAELQASKEKTIDELTRVNESKLYNLNKMVEEAHEEINKAVKEHESISNQIEDDNDRQIDSIKTDYEKMIKAATESNFRLKGEAGVLKKKIFSAEKEIDVIHMETMVITSDIEKLKANIRGLEQEILDLKKEVGERDMRIQDKERRIYDLKRKDQEYERYKFLLNYRIKELKGQIEPRDLEIKEKKEQISVMEIELEEIQKVNMTLDNQLNAMRDKLKHAYELLHVYKHKGKVITTIIQKVKTDIYLASGKIQDPKKLREEIKKLYSTYITDKEFKKAREGDEECISELMRQKNYLEGIAQSLEKQVEAAEQVKYGEGIIYMEMNWALMEEINKIRKKLKVTMRKVGDLESLISVKLSKIYSPRTANRLLHQVLTSEEEIKEELQIKADEALGKAEIMREEIESLEERIFELVRVLQDSDHALRQRKNLALKFNIPSII